MFSNAELKKHNNPLSLCLVLIHLLFASMYGCAPAPVEEMVLIANTLPPTSSPTATLTVTVPPPTATDSPLPTITPLKRFPICSPLDSYQIDQLPDMISNPYYPPEPGSDDPHQGVDLTVLLPNSQIAIAGSQVNAALSGTVAGVIQDRFPYGNAVIVEVPLNDLSPAWIEQLDLPKPLEGAPPTTNLTCPPQTDNGAFPATGEQSLYLLYAHLADLPAFQLDDWIQCGWVLGSVGMSGNALNPHLHLEMRVGPSGARFEGMAHYTASATSEEMTNYCAWRVSGQFQVIDPMLPFSLDR